MTGDSRPKGSCLQLFALSFITLFLELMIIRWVPASVRLVAYYANLMLISSFLGIGLGALLKEKGLNLFRAFPYVLAAYTVFLIVCQQAYLPGFSGEHRFYSVAPDVANFTVLICIFLLNTAVFVPLGERMGQLFDTLPRLPAYSWDLGGSLVGTVAFGGFSLLFFSPLLGFVLVAGLYLLLAEPRSRASSALLLAVSLVYVHLSSPKEAIWSPYYYVTIHEMGGDARKLVSAPPDGLRSMTDPPSYVVRVNQDFYQIHGTIDTNRYTHGAAARRSAEELYRQYTIPYRLRPSPERVLVVGSGGGQDVEGALLNGAREVDAVEIDPVIVSLSRRFNASGVYLDPRVRVHSGDARAFFNNARPGYDMVLFGYLDSQALFSSMTSIRLDGFVYTVESLRAAYGLLRPDGVMALLFSGPGWMHVKLVQMVFEATREIPVVYLAGPQVCIMAAKGGHADPPPAHGRFERVDLPASLDGLDAMPAATDDWPFLYLRARSVPRDYLTVIGALVLISAYILFGGRRIAWGASQTHFFLLGFGFLLLETKSITSCSLYFGTTWFVTTLVVAGILLMVLCANLVAMRLRSFSPRLYIPLLASLLVLLAVPDRFVLGFPLAARLAWTLVLVPLPVFFAGLIFSTTFREGRSGSSSFGANLIGATLGGFSEYLGMALGYHGLSVLVIVAYLASLLLMVRKTGGATSISLERAAGLR